MPLTLELCNNKQEWDGFVRSSPQGNPFCATYFLEALGEQHDLLFVKKYGDIQLGALVLKHEGQPCLAPYPFTMYQGILLNKASMDMPYHKRSKWALELIDFLLSEMEKRYSLISFCLHYGIDDIRSFQWFHYHEPQHGQFNIDLCYTGLLDISTIADFESYLMNIRKVRRYEYRQAKREEFVVKESKDLDMLIKLHDLTFERQGIKRDDRKRQLVKNIGEAVLSKNTGKLLTCIDKNGEVASASLFLHDNRCGYYLFGANNEKYLKTGSGTYLLLEHIRLCKDMGLKKVDFVGINSPNRGDFKTSFNARPVPYFVVTWERHNR